MSDVKVSVIVPVYTVKQEYLKECILSIMHQTLKDIEIILVDDGAPKENGCILDFYAGKDARIKVVHKGNEGASAARNVGLKMATGKYVTFVDSDDYISEENLEIVYNQAEKMELELLMWGSYKLFPNEKVVYGPYVDDIELFNEKQKEQLELKAMAGSLPVYEYPCSKYGSGSCCSKLYLLSFLRKNQLLYPVGIERAEDVNFNIRVFEAAERIGYMNKHLYYYRQLSSSATYKYRENGIEVFTKALNGLHDFLVRNKKSEYFMQVYYMRCMFFFIESMDMDYFNPNNPKPLFVRIKEMRYVRSKDPYKEAFKKLKLSSLTWQKQIPLVLIKLNAMGLLALFYKVYRKTAAK